MNNEKIKELADYLQYKLDAINKVNPIISSDSAKAHALFLENNIKNDTLIQQNLNELAKIERHQQLQDNGYQEPNIKLDFNKFKRRSAFPDCVEVYTGDRWVVVPRSAKMSFSQDRAGKRMTVHIRMGMHSTTYSHNHFNPQEFTQDFFPEFRSVNLSEAELIDIKIQEDLIRKYNNVGIKIKDNAQLAFNANELYRATPEGIKMQCVFKIKDPNAVSSAGRAFRGAGRLSKGIKWFSPMGRAFTMASIYTDLRDETWNMHTAVDGGLLVLEIATGLVIGSGVAVTAGTVVLVGVAVYGLADYIFDIGGVS